MADLNAPNEPFLWHDLVKDSHKRDIMCQKFVSDGYVAVTVGKDFLDLLQALEQRSASFFEQSTNEEKARVCCEFLGQKPTSLRDRLEIRVSRIDQIAFPSLKRDQFFKGFSSEIIPSNQILLETFFEEYLLKAHVQLEQFANHLLSMLCTFLGYSDTQHLIDSLSNEKVTPGVLRLMRYAKTTGTSAPGLEHIPQELAIDHTDIGLLTIMPHASSESLQVLSNDFEWINVEKGIPKDTFIVIAGEQLAYISNYLFTAARHRVVPTANLETRYSFPFLLRCPPNYILKQKDTNSEKEAKLILNHIFSLPPILMELSQSSNYLVKQITKYCSISKIDHSIQLAAATLALPALQIPLSKAPPLWDLILLFESSLPTKSFFKHMSKELGWKFSSIETIHKQGKKQDHLTIPMYRQDDDIWKTSSWTIPEEFGASCTVSGVNGKVTAFRLTMLSRDWISSNMSTKSDPTVGKVGVTVKNCQCLYGRSVLELLFDLNSYRIE